MKKLIVVSAVAAIGVGVFTTPSEAQVAGNKACAYYICGYCKGANGRTIRQGSPQAAQTAIQASRVSLTATQTKVRNIRDRIQRNKTKQTKAGRPLG